MKRWTKPALVAAMVILAGCHRGGGEETAGTRDTLALEVPDDVEQRVEQGARMIGGRVGEALENTGEAIERAGERMKEEAGE